MLLYGGLTGVTCTDLLDTKCTLWLVQAVPRGQQPIKIAYKIYKSQDFSRFSKILNL